MLYRYFMTLNQPNFLYSHCISCTARKFWVKILKAKLQFARLSSKRKFAMLHFISFFSRRLQQLSTSCCTCITRSSSIEERWRSSCPPRYRKRILLSARPIRGLRAHRMVSVDHQSQRVQCVPMQGRMFLPAGTKSETNKSCHCAKHS